jgi:hypothetical protein
LGNNDRQFEKKIADNSQHGGGVFKEVIKTVEEIHNQVKTEKGKQAQAKETEKLSP